MKEKKKSILHTSLIKIWLNAQLFYEERCEICLDYAPRDNLFAKCIESFLRYFRIYVHDSAMIFIYFPTWGKTLAGKKILNTKYHLRVQILEFDSALLQFQGPTLTVVHISMKSMRLMPNLFAKCIEGFFALFSYLCAW